MHRKNPSPGREKIKRFPVFKRASLSSSLLAFGPQALAFKPCEELKSEIAAKIEANGVEQYLLEIVPNDQVGDRKVVGSCDGGTKKIVYTRQ